MVMWKTVAGVVALAGVVVVAAPRLKSSWRNMDLAATPVSKVFVVGFTSETATRRSMEDALTVEIRKNGGTAEPSYKLFPGALPKEAATIKETVVSAGFDGVAVVRVAGVSQEQSWDPGFNPVVPAYYASPWGYWGYWYPFAWDPGYLRTDKTVRVETVVYAVSGVIVWIGLSESTNPGSVRQLIQQVAVPVGVEMKKRNVVR